MMFSSVFADVSYLEIKISNSFFFLSLKSFLKKGKLYPLFNKNI